MVAGRLGKFCRACGGECEPRFEENAAPPAFASLVRGAFLYPLKNDGLFLLATGTLCFALANVATRFSALIGVVVMFFATGYLISYMQRILTASAMGEQRMPDWPDFTDWVELVSPFFQFVCALLVAFAPALAVGMFGGGDPGAMRWGYPIAVALGCVIFPMAFLAVTMFDSLTALNPMLLMPSILKIRFAYLLAVAVMFAAYGVNWLSDRYLETLIPIPILPDVIAEFLSLYLVTVEMRVLGLLYWTKKNDLGWFNH
jgi:hypothetical protein